MRLFADHDVIRADKETREKTIRASQAFMDGPKPAIGFACAFTICLPSARAGRSGRRRSAALSGTT